MNIISNNDIISARNITKTFQDETLNVEVLSGVDMSIGQGEMLAIVGRSGSGKSTLLHILGGLDRPTAGSVEIGGVDIHRATEKDRSFIRNRYLGFVYQFHHLLPEFSALENVAMPLLIGKITPDEATARSRSMLSSVGLADREKHRVAELSGGERQRVAIARALVTHPRCVLADEPTGNLDSATALQVYELILRLKEEFGTSFIIVTHDTTIVEKMMRVQTLEKGRLI
jgi:lipoprotein-releasing system ATP-binding protein